jgi:CubicO group peptidase (beta-lactamase class C family)
MRGSIRTFALLMASIPLTVRANQGGDCNSPIDLRDGWQVEAPAQQNLDPTLICNIGQHLEGWKEGNPHGVVIVRNGVLIYEHYFTGKDSRLGTDLGSIVFDVNTKHDLRSITKSVTSLLVGIAFDHDWLTDLNASVFSYFPEYADLRTPEKDKITLKHLLTMSSGLAWDEVHRPYSDSSNSSRLMAFAADPYRYVLSQKLVGKPGTVWNYNGGGTALLGVILKKVIGRPLDAFAKEALFDPLGIKDWEWERAANGNPSAAAGLRLRPRDLAKIGQLVLAHGAWQGRQLVSAGWVDRSVAPHITGEGMLFGGYEGMWSYGHQWWLGRASISNRKIDFVAGVGLGGQRLYVVPNQHLVIVVTAGTYASPLQGVAGATVLDRFILPAALPH